MSIRKGSGKRYDLDIYEQMGAFSNTATEDIEDPYHAELSRLLEQRNIKEFLRVAIKSKKNIIISTLNITS